MDLSFGAVQNEDIENFHVDVENRESINNVHMSSLEQIEWKDIRVGDILYLRKNEEVPADILLLSTSERRGDCFVGLYFLAFSFIADLSGNNEIERCEKVVRVIFFWGGSTIIGIDSAYEKFKFINE